MRLSAARYLFVSLLIAATYVATGKLGLLLAIPPGYATAVWPPSGIALGALLVFGARFWPAVWLGSFLTNLAITFDLATGLTLQPESIGPASLLGIGAALQALAGSALIRRFVRFPTELLREREIFLFILLGGPIACLIASSIGVCTLLSLGRITADAAPYSWWTWWVGDIMGASIFAPLVVIWFGGEIWKARRAVVSISLVSTFTAAVLVFIYISRLEWQQLEQRLQEDATDLASVIDRRLELNIERTRATAGLFSASSSVERAEFHDFSHFLLGPSSDLQALQWVPRVRNADRATFEKGLAGLGGHEQIFHLEDHNRVTSSERDEYFPVNYIEPLPVNLAAVGFDLASDPVRRKALERARDTGQPSASGPVELVQAGGSHDGFLIFLPLYSNALPSAPTVEERRELLQGFVITVVRAQRLASLASAGRSSSRRLRMRIMDNEHPEPSLYDSGESAKDSKRQWVPGLTYSRTLNFAGRNWTLTFEPTAAFTAGRDTLLSWLVLAGGLFFTTLVGAGAMALTGRTAAVAAQVKERTAELAQTNERLAQADRAKSEFISTVSHELRTPLTSIRGSLGLLNGGALGSLSAKAAELIGMAYRNTDRLQRLINDILDVEKLDSGKLSLELESHSLPTLLAQAVESNAGYAQSHNVRFEMEQPMPEATVRVDPHRLLQVMANLLSNAAKFSPAGTAVEVSMKLHEGQARVGVQDRGPGIPPEFQPRIFQRFAQAAQADASDSRARSGTGLGLAISKALIERMGGRLDYKTAPQTGTLFFFDLPLTAV